MSVQKIVAHIFGETPGHSFAKLAVTNQKYNHFNHESTTTTRLQEHNDKYIYKSVVSLLQYISKDILSLQWPLSNGKKGRPYQFCHTNDENNSHDKTPPEVHGAVLNNRDIPDPLDPPHAVFCFSSLGP